MSLSASPFSRPFASTVSVFSSSLLSLQLISCLVLLCTVIHTTGAREITHLVITDADLEFSDTEQGEVTNSDQQVLYINHGGGAVSTIRRSFAIPFSPHVSSYPTSLYDSEGPSSVAGDTPFSPALGEERAFAPDHVHDHPVDTGSPVEHTFSRRSNAHHTDTPSDTPVVDGVNDQPPPPPQRERDYAREVNARSPPSSSQAVSGDTGRSRDSFDTLPTPAPAVGDSFSGDLGALFPDIERTRPLSLNARDRSNIHVEKDTGHGDRVTSTAQRDERVTSNLHADNQYNNPSRGNHNRDERLTGPLGNNQLPVNPLTPLFQPLAGPFVQPLNPDFFSFFDAPFNALGGGSSGGSNNGVNSQPPSSGSLDNLFQRRRLTVNNSPDITNNAIGNGGNGGASGYPSYNLYKGNEDDLAKWPKIFKFTDGRINLNDFEKDKKLGRIKFTKPDPLFDDSVHRDVTAYTPVSGHHCPAAALNVSLSARARGNIIQEKTQVK